jgi:hypothetical protein
MTNTNKREPDAAAVRLFEHMKTTDPWKVAGELTALGVEAQAEHTGGFIICCYVYKPKHVYCFGDADGFWGADVFERSEDGDHKFLDGESFEIDMLAGTDPKLVAEAIVKAIDADQQKRAAQQA